MIEVTPMICRDCGCDVAVLVFGLCSDCYNETQVRWPNGVLTRMGRDLRAAGRLHA